MLNYQLNELQMINNEDFKTWLNDPCTKFFQKWLKRNLHENKKNGAEFAYNESFRNDKSVRATACFELAKGFDAILGMFNEVNHQVKEEIKAMDLPKDQEKEEIHDVISEMIELVYPKIKEKEDGKDN